MSESVLRTDILSEELKTDQRALKIIAESQFAIIKESTFSQDARTQTPQAAKEIQEVMALIKRAIEDYETKNLTTNENKIRVVYDSPDISEAGEKLEIISMKLIKRQPGMHGQGAPFENTVRQLKPLLRETLDDPDNPGYKRLVLGQFYDNLLQLTCWAKTNKEASERALWLETVMEDYAWFFAYSGANRVIYQGRAPELLLDVDHYHLYGRPIEYFVRTEKIRTVSQKQLEEIIVRLCLSPE